jgi:hypothetical protein
MREIRLPSGYTVWARKVEPEPGQHDHNDPKPPTRWRIDWAGHHIGYVQSKSRRIVKTRLPSGAIVSYQKGFGRNWVATFERGTIVTDIARTMTEACEDLLADAIKRGVTP